jgi:hypothetical protein
MDMRRRRTLSTLATLIGGSAAEAVLGPGTSRAEEPRVAAEMGRAAAAFLTSLRPEQRPTASITFTDPERENWHYIPRSRKGIPLKALTPEQRSRAEDLMRTGLSAKGFATAEAIMSLEHVLRHMENNPGRDSELYYVSLFGTPSPSAAVPWGWRVEGHHLSLNFAIAGDRVVGATPLFLGSNPGEVRVAAPNGPPVGTRVLAAQEDIARRLLQSLRPDQRRVTVIAEQAMPDIVTGALAKVDPLAPAGLSVATFTREQKRTLDTLLEAYAAVMAPDLAKERLAGALGAGLEKLSFAWAGGPDPGQPHYYRVQGPTFLVEFDNTQDNANHIHSVWRDFKGDFGRDVLREHYAQGHHHDHHDHDDSSHADVGG